MESGRYDTRDDFTVQYQPTFKNMRFPTFRDRRSGKEFTDYSYLAVDCFHYSQKFHALGESNDAIKIFVSALGRLLWIIKGSTRVAQDQMRVGLFLVNGCKVKPSEINFAFIYSAGLFSVNWIYNSAPYSRF